MKKKYIILILLLGICVNLFAQIPEGMPPISNYTDEDYYAGTQNWFAVQDSVGFMYFANTSGVLVFDGINWQQISVNNKAVRSLAIDDNGKIWVAAKYELGYIDIDKNGKLVYVSMIQQIPEKYRNFTDVWNVFILENNEMFFFTNKYIISLKNNEFDIIEAENKEKGFTHAYFVNNTIFVQEYKNGVHRYKNQSLIQIDSSQIFNDTRIKAILPTQTNDLVFITLKKGVYKYNGNKFEQTETPIDNIIENKIYKAFYINDGYYAISVYNHGLIIVDDNFNIIKTINISNGILSNNVYHIFNDRDNNIWLSTDEGISSFSLFPKYTLWGLNFGLNTKTRTSAFFDNKLFIGNTSGVYFYELHQEKNRTQGLKKFQQIKNNNQEINAYFLKECNGTLLGLSQEGLFQIKNEQVIYIIKKNNLRNFIKYDEKTIIVGGKKGLHIVEFINDSWIYKNKINGFDASCLFLQKDEKGNIWTSNKNKGVTKVILSKNKENVSIQNYDKNNLKGLPQFNDNYIYKINENIVVATKKGIYKYDYQKDLFVPYQEINSVIGNVPVQMIYSDSHNNIWLKVVEYETKNRQKVKVWNLVKLELQKDGSYKQEKNMFKSFQSKIFSFSQIDDSLFIIGNKKGFTIYNDNKDIIKEFPTLIRSFDYIVNRDSSVTLFGGVRKDSTNYFSFNQDKIIELLYKNNSVRFSYSALDFNNNTSLQFSCYLEGFDNDWTSWSPENSKEYANLKEGEYTFFVKAKNVYNTETKPAQFHFVIYAPWYRTAYAYISYIVLIILALYFAFRLYTRNLRKRKEYLEEIVKIRTAEISQQNEEITTQNEMLYDKNEEIEQQKYEIEIQRDIAYRSKKEITDSIIYAKRIQIAIMPRKEYLEDVLPEHFILFKPRDIVSGDYYWVNKVDNKLLILTADSTGHGVPGAFMSMLGISLMNEIIAYNKINEPGEVLDILRSRLKEALHQQGNDDDTKDGYDLSFYIINNKTFELEFSGAFNSIYVFKAKNKELIQLKADRQPIAVYVRETNFKTHKIQLEKGDVIYSFSDGYADQFGGDPKNPQKYKTKKFKKLLLLMQNKNMDQQKFILNKSFEEWRGDESQLDDVIVIGVKI